MHLQTYMIFGDLKLPVCLFWGSDLSEIVYNASKLANFIAARLIDKMLSETTWILSWWLLLQQVLAHSILHGSSRNWMHECCTFSYSLVNFANFVDLFLQTVVLAELKAALNLYSITATSSNWSRSHDLVLHLLQILVCPFTEAYLGAELC